MKHNFFLISLFFFLSLNLVAQVNIKLVSRLEFGATHKDTKQSDVWGYVGKDGVEYAMVGLTGYPPLNGGVAIVSLKDPKKPEEIAFIEGENTTWWDMKTWNNHLYIVNEGGGGLAIVDLNKLPEADDLEVTYYTGPEDSSWSTAHNIFIDSTGFAYIFGANRAKGGVIFLDLNNDPKKPKEVGGFDNFYAHDGYVLNQKLYAANVLDGFFTIVDVADKTSPKILGQRTTPSNFSHNIWVSDNEKTAFTTDEKRGAYIVSYDIQDPSDVNELGRVQSKWSEGVIPHNTHWHNNYLITSYYTDGLLIHDVSNPAVMVEVGSYDTHPWFGGGFNGCWGAYPFLPSGLILASDIERGLFVLEADYQRAGYLKGITYNIETGNPLKGVEVKLLQTKSETLSNVSGDYEIGVFPTGVFDIVFRKLGYYSDTIRDVKIESGKTAFLVDSLKKQESYAVKGIVKDSLTGTPVPNVKIRFEIKYAGVIYDYLGESDSTGEFVVENLEDDFFRLFVGKWGYKTICADTFVAKDKYYEIFLPKGYYDDFSFDFGWEVSGEAKPKEGKWELGIPKSTIKIKANQQFYANPNEDAPNDCGFHAFVTGNSGNTDWDDDLDSSETILTSPLIDFTDYTDPYISYYRWFLEATYFDVDKENDTLKVFLINKEGEEYLIDQVLPSSSNRGGWKRKAIRVNDFFDTPKEGYRIKVVVKDSPTSPNAEDILEAGLDHFMVTEGNPIGIDEVNAVHENINVFPNPFDNEVVIEIEETGVFKGKRLVEVFDFFGRKLYSNTYNFSGKSIKLDTKLYPKGIYFIKVDSENGSQTFKLIKTSVK